MNEELIFKKMRKVVFELTEKNLSNDELFSLFKDLQFLGGKF